MTDRELLELAAKAEGRQIFMWDETIKRFWILGDEFWNPLEDDGDALRLAVTLELTVSTWGEEIEIWAGPEGYGLDDPIVEPSGPDKNAATRRAIVRAAAEIGRAMT